MPATTSGNNVSSLITEGRSSATARSKDRRMTSGRPDPGPAGNGDTTKAARSKAARSKSTCSKSTAAKAATASTTKAACRRSSKPAASQSRSRADTNAHAIVDETAAQRTSATADSTADSTASHTADGHECRRMSGDAQLRVARHSGSAGLAGLLERLLLQIQQPAIDLLTLLDGSVLWTDESVIVEDRAVAIVAAKQIQIGTHCRTIVRVAPSVLSQRGVCAKLPDGDHRQQPDQ